MHRWRRSTSHPRLRAVPLGPILIVACGGVAAWICTSLEPGLSSGNAAGLGLVLPLLAATLSLPASADEEIVDDVQVEGDCALLRAALDTASEGVLILASDGRIRYHNRRFLQLWGVDDLAELTDFNACVRCSILPRLADPEGTDLCLCQAPEGASAESSVELTLFDGRVLACCSRPYDLESLATGRIWTFRDISDQRRVETALAASERRFHRLAANVPGVIFQFHIARDNSPRYTYLSEGCKTLLGVEPDGFPWNADELLTRIHPEDLASLTAATMRSARLMEPWSWEGRLSLGDDQVKWIRAAARPSRDDEGRRFWDGLMMDVTEEKRALEALHRSEERFRQMAESIGEVFFMINLDPFDLVYLSPAFEEVWGRSREEVLGNRFDLMETILPDDRHIVRAEIALSRSGRGDPQRVLDYRIARPDGTIRWVRNRTVQIPDLEGRPYRVAGVCSDVTEQKQMEEELRRSNRIEAIGHLAAGIAHEINTPIQYIGDNLRFLDDSYADLRRAMEAYHALLEMVREGPVPTQQIREITALIQVSDVDYLLREAPRASSQALDGVQRVAEIVRAMKEFSHPGTGQRIPTDLNQSIISTTTVARNEWKYVAELVTDLDPSLPLVHCLPGELNQAILNLVVNAAHAIADRRQSEAIDELGIITVSTSLNGDWVEIRVSDTGTGIPEEIRGRIFDPFFTTKEVGRGTGQGLTFVHSIVVDKHRGTVGFSTEQGAGTTFVVRLPYRSEAFDASEAA